MENTKALAQLTVHVAGMHTHWKCDREGDDAIAKTHHVSETEIAERHVWGNTKQQMRSDVQGYAILFTHVSVYGEI